MFNLSLLADEQYKWLINSDLFFIVVNDLIINFPQ